MKRYDFNSLLYTKELSDKEACVTIGVFDGFHLGHKALIERVKKESRKIESSISVVITFSTNPKPGKMRNIDTLRLREEVMSKEGIDAFVVIDFSHEFSMITASGFLNLLYKIMKPRVLVVGEDFRFGNPSSSATAQDLEHMLSLSGCDAKVIIEKSILTEGGEKISSTLVRRVIEKGETGCIPSLIGRKYRVDLMPCPFRFDNGILVYSRDSIHQLLPPPGVYDSNVLLRNGFIVEGVCRMDDSSMCFIPYINEDNKKNSEDLLLDSIFFGEQK